MAQVKEAGGDMSVLQTIVTIVPSNLVDPFLNVNSHQLVFLALLCGIELFNSDILTMIFTVVCLILGINFLIEMLLAMSNTAGDAVISFIVARSENLVDLDCYYSK